MNPVPSEEDKKLVVVKSLNAINPLVYDYSVSKLYSPNYGLSIGICLLQLCLFLYVYLVFFFVLAMVLQPLLTIDVWEVSRIDS